MTPFKRNVYACQEKLQWKDIAAEITAMEGQPPITAYLFWESEIFSSLKIADQLQSITTYGGV
jgi:hypothetical protein